jgi:hypothetical protein
MLADQNFIKRLSFSEIMGGVKNIFFRQNWYIEDEFNDLDLDLGWRRP